MNSLVISIGSNSKDREWQMKNCIDWLKRLLSDMRISSIYNTVASNGKDADYLNTVIKAKCRDSFDYINSKMKEYEKVCGRTPSSKLEGDIPLDIDIVMWNNEVIREWDYNQIHFKIGWNELLKKNS